MSPSLMVYGIRPVSNVWLYGSVRIGATSFSCALYTSAGIPSGPAILPGPMLRTASRASSTVMRPSSRRLSSSVRGRSDNVFSSSGSLLDSLGEYSQE
eukprot:scaffold134169_cov29-Tisochrysis_lutea.AAC.1